MLKSLCGYEYITNVMLGGIEFFLIEIILAMFKKDRKKVIVSFKNHFFPGYIFNCWVYVSINGTFNT